VLFLFIFTCNLCVMHLPLSLWQVRAKAVAAATSIPQSSANSGFSVSTNTGKLLQQGLKKYKAGDLKGAIQDWKIALRQSQGDGNHASTALLIDYLALAYQQMGQTKVAIEYWHQALAFYQQVNDILNVGHVLVKQAQAYNNLGKTNKAIIISENALQIARTYNNDLLKLTALVTKGEAYRLQGNYKRAIFCFKSSLEIAQEFPHSGYYDLAIKKIASTYISLSQINYNLANSALEAGDSDEARIFNRQAFEYDLKALKYLQKSLNIARQYQDKISEINLLVDSILPTYRVKEFQLARAKLQLATSLLANLPNSQQKVYAAIKLAQIIQSLPGGEILSLAACSRNQEDPKVMDLLNKAVSIAASLHAKRALSFALGYLGHVYECQHNYQQALTFTRQAQQAVAGELNAEDSLYLWQWQTGRILKAQNLLLEAIAAYNQAIATFSTRSRPKGVYRQIRDQAIADFEVQIDRYETVKQMYRELIAIKLSLEDLNSVLTTIDALKITELSNYFEQDPEVQIIYQPKVDLLKTPPNTAMFWSIIQPERTAIIVSLPNGEVKFKWIQLDSKSIKQEINAFRIGLEKRSDIIYNHSQAQKLYNWIVRPFEKDLQLLQVETLVFIPDGLFHSIPMAALSDGKQFLIQKYALSSIASVSLTNTLPTQPEKLRALVVGLTKNAVVDGQQYQALASVKEEINQVTTLIPGSKQLLDENFTRDRLQAEIHKAIYPIIHIATHGEYNLVSEDTFLITGNNEKLAITDLYAMIHNAAVSSNTVELLVLSACETARGDDRTGLSLTNIAVLAGVKSTLASLWSVNDAATAKLVTQFYKYWHNERFSKARALQKAQQELIALGKKYAHPYYWAPFILSGNWL
jgi:CHAT domain-containing protein